MRIVARSLRGGLNGGRKVNGLRVTGWAGAVVQQRAKAREGAWVMARLLECNNCGHGQYIGENPVDGRTKWWTRCERCGKGDFMSPPDPAVLDMLAEAYASLSALAPVQADAETPRQRPQPEPQRRRQ